MATLKKLKKQLRVVEKAIEEIEQNGERLSVDGLDYSTAKLQTLYDREQELENKIARKTRRSQLFRRITT